MKTFTCPKCGATLQYDGLKDILSCPYCGSAVEKESGIIERISRYKERKEARKLEEIKRQEKRTEEGLGKLRIMLGVMILIWIIVHYFGAS